jgi:hypothetical protein
MGILLPLRILVLMQRPSVRCSRGVLGVVNLLRLDCVVDRLDGVEFENRRERRRGRGGKKKWVRWRWRRVKKSVELVVLLCSWCFTLLFWARERVYLLITTYIRPRDSNSLMHLSYLYLL